MKWQKIPKFLYNKVMKQRKYKEPESVRKERIALSGATRTRIVKDKTKYNRKQKHKGIYND